jgi:hypothetical protein
MQMIQPLRGSDLSATDPPQLAWTWEGLLAGGSVTLLTGLWKSGKSTLLSFLLAQRRRGGILLDRFVMPGASMVISEEPADVWRRRSRCLDFGPNLSLYCRPFAGKPYLWQWKRFVEQLVQEQESQHIDLVAIDPLAGVLPASENNVSALVAALQPLRELTERGAAVLLLHHPAKEDGGLGKAARGSGALPAFADIVLELRLCGNVANRRRRLFGLSRFEETPRRLVFELNQAGNDYQVVVGNESGDDFAANWEILAAILAAAGTPVSRQEMCERWPKHRCPPHDATLWRWLRRAGQLGLIAVTGAGTKHAPFRFELKASTDAAKSA